MFTVWWEFKSVSFCRHRIPHSHLTGQISAPQSLPQPHLLHGAFTGDPAVPHPLLQDPVAFCLQQLHGLLLCCPFSVRLGMPYLSPHAANTSHKSPLPRLQPFRVCCIRCGLMKRAWCGCFFLYASVSHCHSSQGR